MRRRLAPAVLVVVLAALATTSPAGEEAKVSIDAYAEWHRPAALIVDGQRVTATSSTKWKGKFKRLADVPLGSEVRVKGTRAADGAVVASEIDVRPNGNALFEDDVLEGSHEVEQAWVDEGMAFDDDGSGELVAIGEIVERGPTVRRVNRLVDRLLPPHVSRDQVRAYVIDNEEWNAMAMGNGAIWVFSGLAEDMSDEELSIVIGHELAHFTHEHSRRGMRREMRQMLLGLGALAAAELIGKDGLREGVQLGIGLTLAALSSGYGRDLEDQADRVGLRYAYEAGIDVRQAPRVWRRFLEKYGDEHPVVNFFFSDHSRASVRERNLQDELRFNYSR